MARQRISYPLRALFPPLPRPAALLVTTGVLLLVLAWGGLHALPAIGEFLVVEDDPREAEAIVVLSGDGGARLEQGVELFKKGYAPRLILSGGGQAGRPAAAEVMRRQAVAMGVPSSATLLVDRSSSTWEDALYTKQLMQEQGLRSAILVTSPYHQRRAALTFDHVFRGSGVSVRSYPVQDDQWKPGDWWRHRSTLRLTLEELAKLIYYKLSGYL